MIDDLPLVGDPLHQFTEVSRRSGRVNFSEDDLLTLSAQGISIDDDNAPAPENSPDDDETVTDCDEEEVIGDKWHGDIRINKDIYWQGWGQRNVCPRRINGFLNMKPSLHGVNSEVAKTMSLLELFMTFFLMDYVKASTLPETSIELENNGDARPLTIGEFVRFLWLWMVMATTEGYSHDDWWSRVVVDPENDKPPMRFNNHMSRGRFRRIIKSLRLTNEDPPEHRDKFFHVCQLLKSWNVNMSECFNPGWINCLDESMSYWIN